ncbi:DUF6555 family protein [Pseudomonas syringae]
MKELRCFQICYHLGNVLQTFIQPDSHMTDGDAWYYACLHARVELVYSERHSQTDIDALQRNAQKAGLSRVTWVELP